MRLTTLTSLLTGLLWLPGAAQAQNQIISAAPAQASGIQVMQAGSQPSTLAAADHFTGTAKIDARFSHPAPSRLGGALVTFEPGARTDWHSHPLGQTLFVTSGTGWVQAWGQAPQLIRQGDLIWIPPGIKHWHGATANSAMAHFAFSEAENGSTVVWMEKVTDEQYPAK